MTTTSEKPGEIIRADHVPGPRQGEWTYSHYAVLPDDGQRYEIIDGVLYMAPASPLGWHQRAVNRFAYYLTTYVEFAGFGLVYPAPFDVELAFHTVVQPDVLVMLNESLERIVPTRVIGAPDLVVEVLSPGTAKYDRSKKYRAYARAGVREYWIADPRACSIEVLTLEGGEYRSVGVFSGEQTLRSQVVPDFPVAVKEFFPN
jgi:Uma2 family endonuclease